MSRSELAHWEEVFCLPFYRRGWTDSNTVYLESQKFYARCAPGGEAQDLEGIYATSCGTSWAGLNLGFLSEPVRRVSALHARIERALDFYRKRNLPWILVAPDDWIAPGLQAEVESALRDRGFQLAMEGRAISAELLAAFDEPPFSVERAESEGEWALIAAINSASWNIPVEWVSPLLGSPAFQAEAHGWIGRVAGEAVSAVVTFPALHFTFCAWGATLPEHRRHGFGAYITRYAAAQAERGRPLFAVSSPQGLKTWVAAGFEPRERFRLFMAPI